ncbi:type II toxin-antitoxin system RelE/ParE family toxin [Bacteroides fragilis]
MEAKAKFDVVLSPEASDFLNGLGSKIRDKIVYNIRKSTYIIDPKLFKKLDDTDIWEFRTRHSNTQYRLLAFWDKTSDMDTLVIATHGFIKKTQKTPSKEIVKAEEIRKAYFNSKKKMI